MKKGDIVVITEEDLPYFRGGDKARLTGKDADGDWWGDFNNMGNENVYLNGVWCITQIGKCKPANADVTGLSPGTEVTK